MEKTILELQAKLLLLYIAFFPFGQIFKLVGFPHPTDIVVIILLVVSGLTKQIPNKLMLLIAILIFGNIYGSLVLDQFGIVSLLYLIRLVAYINLSLVVINLIKEKVLSPTTIKQCLVVVMLVITIFGWIQYLIKPDLRELYFLGWDDHLGRLVGTFLDPGFIGIILLLGFILINNLPTRLFIIITLLLTYSRASYLALLSLFIYLLFLKNKKLLLLLITVLIVSVLLLPQGTGEGVNLLRTKSIELRLENYKQSINIIFQSPLFGFGFNNNCIAKERILGFTYGGVHGCGGLDNSYLFLFATTGIVGVLAFIDHLNKLISIRSELFMSSAIVVGVHAVFHNTLFYPFVLGWLAIIYAMEYKQPLHPSQ